MRIKGEESEKNNDYYKRDRCDYSNWSLASRTYGKYVMYYEWLKGLGEPTLPVTSLGENNISATEKKEKPLLEIINEIPVRAKKAFEIYQIEFKRLNNSKQAKTNMIRQIFDAKEIYVCKNYENTRTQIGRDFKKYNLISQKTTIRKR